MLPIIYDELEARQSPRPRVALPDFMTGDVVEEAQQGSLRCRQRFDDGVALRVEDREPGSFRQRLGAHGSQLRRARPYQCARGEREEARCHALLGSWLTDGRSGRSDGQRSFNCRRGLETDPGIRLSAVATRAGRGAVDS